MKYRVEKHNEFIQKHNICKCQLKNVQFLESQNVQLLELIITAFFAFK